MSLKLPLQLVLNQHWIPWLLTALVAMKIFVETDLLLWESSCTYQTLDSANNMVVWFYVSWFLPLEMRCEVLTLHRFFGSFWEENGLKSDRMFSHFWLDIRCCAYISHNMRSSGGPWWLHLSREICDKSHSEIRYFLRTFWSTDVIHLGFWGECLCICHL